MIWTWCYKNLSKNNLTTWILQKLQHCKQYKNNGAITRPVAGFAMNNPLCLLSQFCFLVWYLCEKLRRLQWASNSVKFDPLPFSRLDFVCEDLVQSSYQKTTIPCLACEALDMIFYGLWCCGRDHIWYTQWFSFCVNNVSGTCGIGHVPSMWVWEHLVLRTVLAILNASNLVAISHMFVFWKQCLGDQDFVLHRPGAKSNRCVSANIGQPRK